VRYIVATHVVFNFGDRFWHVVSSCGSLSDVLTKRFSFDPAIKVIDWWSLRDIGNRGCSRLRLSGFSSFRRFLGSSLSYATSVSSCRRWSFRWCTWPWRHSWRPSGWSSNWCKSCLLRQGLILPIVALGYFLCVKSLNRRSKRNCRLFEISYLILSDVGCILLAGLLAHHLFLVYSLAGFIFKSVGISLLLFLDKTLYSLLLFNSTLKLSFQHQPLPNCWSNVFCKRLWLLSFFNYLFCCLLDHAHLLLHLKLSYLRLKLRLSTRFSCFAFCFIFLEIQRFLAIITK
jgi:hypothetical protein